MIINYHKETITFIRFLKEASEILFIKKNVAMFYVFFLLFGDATLIPIHYTLKTLSQFLLSQHE